MAACNERNEPMRVDQASVSTETELPRVRSRAAPLCYSRTKRVDELHQTRVAEQSRAIMMILGVITCAAAFLAVHGALPV
jgi:hypothetical protein